MIPVPIRLMIDTGNAPPHGGVGVFSNGLARALGESDRRRAAVVKCGASRAALRWRTFARAEYLLRIRGVRKTADVQCDVLHFTNTLVPLGKWNVKVVSTVHDLDAVRFPHLYPPRYRHYARAALSSPARRADIVHTVSETTRETFLDGFRIDGARVRRIWIGLSPDLIERAATVGQSAPEGPPIVLFVGALEKKKNLAWLVREVAGGVVSGAIPRVRLLLAGSPKYGFPEIDREVARSRGIARCVQNPSLDTLIGLYRAAHVVVLPSFAEGFGFPLIEAMFFGKEIVASRIPSSLEVGGNIPWFFDLDNRDEFYAALRGALDVTPAARAAAQQERLKLFLWQNLIQDYERLYEDCRVM